MKDKILVMEVLLSQAGVAFNKREDMFEYYYYLECLCLNNISHMVLLELGI